MNTVGRLRTRNASIWRAPAADVFAVWLVITILILLGLSSTGEAQDSGAGVGLESPESITLKLLDLNARHLSGTQSNNAQLLSELQTVAATRQQLLAALAESNPGEILQVALPANVRETFPASVQAFLEQQVDAEGVLEVAVEDRKQESRLHFSLQSGGERLTLNFATDPPVHLLTGSHVRVHGVRVGNELALSSGTSTTSLQVVAATSWLTRWGTTLACIIPTRWTAELLWSVVVAPSANTATGSTSWALRRTPRLATLTAFRRSAWAG